MQHGSIHKMFACDYEKKVLHDCIPINKLIELPALIHQMMKKM